MILKFDFLKEGMINILKSGFSPKSFTKRKLLKLYYKTTKTFDKKPIIVTALMKVDVYKLNIMIEIDQSKKEGKDQESIQSSTAPDPGYQ